mmetsp:Transcript_73642/g.221382  ORF Transcript_73642/g.221382 Transcript_73642/m.221382 type:complete len:256 (-) Transcript_73642:619-1386(-)
MSWAYHTCYNYASCVPCAPQKYIRFGTPLPLNEQAPPAQVVAASGGMMLAGEGEGPRQQSVDIIACAFNRGSSVLKRPYRYRRLAEAQAAKGHAHVARGGPPHDRGACAGAPSSPDLCGPAQSQRKGFSCAVSRSAASTYEPRLSVSVIEETRPQSRPLCDAVVAARATSAIDTESRPLDLVEAECSTSLSSSSATRSTTSAVHARAKSATSACASAASNALPMISRAACAASALSNDDSTSSPATMVATSACAA